MRDQMPASSEWLLKLVDALCLLGTFGAAYVLLPYYGPLLNPDFASLSESGSLLLLVLALPLWLLLLDWAGMYADLARSSYSSLVLGLIRVSLLGLSLLTLLVFAARAQAVSRLFVFSFGLLGFVVLTTVRVVGKQYYDARRQAGYYTRYLLVVGSKQNGEVIEKRIQDSHLSQDYGIGFLVVDNTVNSNQPVNMRLRGVLARQQIGEVLVVDGPHTERDLGALVATCSELGRPVRLVSESMLQYWNFSDATSLNAYTESFLGLPSVLFLRARPRPAYELAKRLVDIVVSASMLVILFPVFVAIAIAIKVSSPGPILYRWRVLGQNNREFVGYKFRTMVANADQLKAGLLKHNEMAGPVFKMKNDPRVTPIGQFLRKYSLDELPQLWNVLKGDMSLVGPRPPLKDEFERFEFWQARKLSVRPGMTCLWQVRGRNEIKDFAEWAHLDLEYIDKRSLWLDVQILWLTLLAVLRGTGR